MLNGYLKKIFNLSVKLDKKVIARTAIAFLFFFFFFFSNRAIAITPEQQAAIDSKRAELEEQIAKLRQEIDSYKNDISQKEKEKKKEKTRIHSKAERKTRKWRGRAGTIPRAMMNKKGNQQPPRNADAPIEHMHAFVHLILD